MLELAERLSHNLPFVRVDFYNIEGKIYIGELTFYPYGIYGKLEPREWDMELGKLLNLNRIKI